MSTRMAGHREGPVLQRSEPEVTVRNPYFRVSVVQWRKPRPMKMRLLRVTLLESE